MYRKSYTPKGAQIQGISTVLAQEVCLAENLIQRHHRGMPSIDRNGQVFFHSPPFLIYLWLLPNSHSIPEHSVSSEVPP